MKRIKTIERCILIGMIGMLLVGLIVEIRDRNTNPLKGIKRERIYRIKD